MVESAPLLREYTLIAYRGFESLSLRQTKKAPLRGAFFWSGGERGLMKTLRFDKMRQHFGPPPGAPQGSKRELQSRFESIPLKASLLPNKVSGFFYVWRRERIDESPGA